MPCLRPLLLLALLAACGRSHLLVEGGYRMAATEVLRDDCGLLAAPEDLPDGELMVTGDLVRVRYALLQGLVLQGRYVEGVERFTVDGTALSTVLPVRGRSCLVDRVAVTLDADADEEVSPLGTAFDGLVRVRVEAEREPACACELAARMRAEYDPAVAVP